MISIFKNKLFLILQHNIYSKQETNLFSNCVVANLDWQVTRIHNPPMFSTTKIFDLLT